MMPIRSMAKHRFASLVGAAAVLMLLSCHHHASVVAAAAAAAEYMDSDSCKDGTNENSCLSSTTNILQMDAIASEIVPAAVDDQEIYEEVHQVHIHPSVRKSLLEYCNKVGITQRFQTLLQDPLELNQGSTETFQDGLDWHVQRHDWFSDNLNDNVHWVSPANDKAHDKYLQLLGDANFDNVLSSMGDYFGLDSLVVYSVAFHAVSRFSKQGDVLVDHQDTDGRAWTIMIPLMLSENATEAELGIVVQQDEQDEKVMSVKLQENVAILLGDDARYFFQEVTNETRIVATVMVADVNVENIESIVESYTDQPYPPQDIVQWLYDRIGDHWGPWPSQKLPKHTDTEQDELARTARQLASMIPHKRELQTHDALDRDYADRFVHGIIDTLHDDDCMTREFDASSINDFDVDTAAHVLQKCKLVVLRNVFDKDFLNDYRESFANYIQAIHERKIPSTGTTTNNEKFYLHQIANKRWEVILPKAFAHRDLLMNHDVMDILQQRHVLGKDLVLHSLGTALAESGAQAQLWHNDDDYIFRDLFGAAGLGGHDLPSYAVTMMVPLLNMTNQHGPTEFCMGSSYINHFEDDANDIPLKDESLRPILKSYLYGSDQDFCPSPRRIPQLKFGDVLLFDYQILHRGGANDSPDLRSVMYMTYAREWYKDSNFRKRVKYDDFDNEWDALFHQLTRSARFAIPNENNEEESDEEEEETDDMESSSDTLESIQQFLPPTRFVR